MEANSCVNMDDLGEQKKLVLSQATHDQLQRPSQFAELDAQNRTEFAVLHFGCKQLCLHPFQPLPLPVHLEKNPVVVVVAFTRSGNGF
jgi:hypothetical protein